MNRVIFFVVLILSSNNIFSQRVPSIDELMKLFEENKYTCSFTPTAERIPIDYEELDISMIAFTKLASCLKPVMGVKLEIKVLFMMVMKK